jgi:integrase
MANRAVTLYKKVKTTDGWRRYPAVIAANGKVKPDTVIIACEEQKIAGGHFELRSFVRTKTKWTRVKGGPAEALAALKTAQAKATAKAEAETAGIKVVEDQKRVSLTEARERFVEAALARGSEESAEVYGRSIEEFIAASGKSYADEINPGEMTKFLAAMRKRGLSDRTISNRHGHAKSFLKFLKIDPDTVKEIAGTKPRYEKTLPEISEPAELKKFFASLTEDYDRLLFDVLLTCGLREQEAMHLEYGDLNRSQRTLKVQSKPRWHFKVKDAEEREIPIGTSLLKRIDAYRKNHEGKSLIFGARGGSRDVPDGHLLRRLKLLARDAGLNCGSCAACVERQECERYFLHKFRATYITTLLRNGLDLRTVMKLSGHSDLESIERYIRPAEGKEVQATVNAIRWR